MQLGLSFSSLIPIRIRRMIGMPWMPIPIRQNDADPIRIHNTYGIIPLMTF